MVANDTVTLQGLLDKNSIEQVLIRYCEAADAADENLLRSVFHVDGTDEHAGMFAGTIDELAPKMVKMHDKFSLTQHIVSNVVIELKGDIAHSRCQVTAHHRYEEQGKSYHLTAGGRYLDRLEKREGEWRIAHRNTHMDWSLTHLVDDSLPSPF
jgi:ketosteroid isomerase-like protein